MWVSSVMTSLPSVEVGNGWSDLGLSSRGSVAEGKESEGRDLQWPHPLTCYSAGNRRLQEVDRVLTTSLFNPGPSLPALASRGPTAQGSTSHFPYVQLLSFLFTVVQQVLITDTLEMGTGYESRGGPDLNSHHLLLRCLPVSSFAVFLFFCLSVDFLMCAKSLWCL